MLRVERFYSSGRALSSDENGNPEPQWIFYFQQYLVIGTDLATAFRPDGVRQYYRINSNPALPVQPSSETLLKIPSGWELHTNEQTIEKYDSTGKLLSVRSLKGGGVVIEYDANATIRRVVDQFGSALTFNYFRSEMRSAKPVIQSVLLPDGITALKYEIDPIYLEINSVLFSDGAKNKYLMESSPQAADQRYLIQEIDESGVAFARFAFDPIGNANATELVGGVFRYNVYPAFDTRGVGGSRVVTPLGVKSFYWFNSVNGLSRFVGADQPGGAGCGASSNAITYGASGNVASRTDFNGVITTYTHDLSRNLEISRTEASSTPQARTTSTQWHATYRLPIKIAEPSRLTTFTYDASGNVLTKVVRATSDVNGAYAFSAALIGTPRTWTWTYNGFGQILTADGPRTDTGIVDKTTNTYDTMGNLASSTDASGKLTAFNSYDLNGRLLKMTDPAGVVSTMTYSPRGWLTSRNVVSGTASELTSYAYDGVGQLTLVTLPDASTVSYTYGDAHRLTQVSDSTGNRIAYTLDAMGNRISEQVTDPAGVLVRQTSRVYDALNRLQQVTGTLQ